jgi:sirohydrochlorin ferrochelatase
METRGIIVFAHGSRVEAANEAVRRVAADLARRGEFAHVEAAFLELGQPDLTGAARLLAARGVHKALILPYFLTLGLHMERDMPRLAAEAAAAVPGMEIETGATLDGHPALTEVLLDRARQAGY